MAESYGNVADRARTKIMEVLFDGDMRGKTGWQDYTPEFHIKHAALHLVNELAGDCNETHVYNAITRLAMAMSVKHEDRLDARQTAQQDAQDDESFAKLCRDEFASEELDR